MLDNETTPTLNNHFLTLIMLEERDKLVINYLQPPPLIKSISLYYHLFASIELNYFVMILPWHMRRYVERVVWKQWAVVVKHNDLPDQKVRILELLPFVQGNRVFVPSTAPETNEGKGH